MDNLEARKNLWRDCRQVVVKAGTRLLTDPGCMAKLISGIAAMREAGLQVMLVSSGAVGTGMRQIQLKKRPKQLAKVQALAAIGQSKLMSLYDDECRKYGFATAQLLLTAADLRSRERYLHVSNCLHALWERDVLPIINENDSVSVAEIKFGDNDTLAGMLATMMRAQLTIILTTEQGLRDRNEDGTLGERVSVVETLDERYYQAATGTDNAELSIGGMTSKLKAAAVVTGAGEHLWIADGRIDGILQSIMKGEDVGTLFLPHHSPMRSRKRWIQFFASKAGVVTIDAGAALAVGTRGKSLLPSGVVAVSGKFKRGDTLEIRSEAGVVVGRGLTNYASDECERIKGLRGTELTALLGEDAEIELIHRDNMVTVQD